MARENFNTRWAQSVEGESSSTTFQNPGSRIATGWEGGADKDAPPAGQENWWHNRVDSAMQDIERFGVMTWIASALYAAGAPVKSLTDGNYYESLGNSNTGNDPSSTTGFWRLLGPSLYGVVPVGSGLTVYHNGVPDTGWLKFNGAVLLRSTYPRLFNVLGTTWNTGGEAGTQFRLPDMRGEFPRGWDDGRGVDTGRVFGTYQADELRSHNHNTTLNLDRAPTTPGNQVYGDEAFYGQTVIASSSTGGNETRPRNRAVNFWIKF